MDENIENCAIAPLFTGELNALDSLILVSYLAGLLQPPAFTL